MMNRVEFVQSINEEGNISPDAIVHFFDHIMATYNIVAKSNTINVSSIIEKTGMHFSIVFNSVEEMLVIDTMIKEELHSTVAMYGRAFHVDTGMVNNTLNLKVY